MTLLKAVIILNTLEYILIQQNNRNNDAQMVRHSNRSIQNISHKQQEFIDRQQELQDNDYLYIEFWECPSKLKWKLHHEVDKDSKSFVVTPFFPSKTSWEFCRKSDSDDLINLWKMTFLASDGKGKNFLELLDDDLNVIELSYTKGGPWLQLVGHSNLLCA